MRHSKLLVLMAALAAALRGVPAQSVLAQAPPADPASVLTQAKQAAGADAWDKVRSLHLQYQTLSGGRTGRQDEWDDVRAGRYCVASHSGAEETADGWDGISVWTQARGGFSYVLGDDDARQGAANQAYQTSRAFWFPERAPATVASAGVQQENGRAFDVLSITPQGGRPFTLWVDRTTHFPDRFVEQQGEDVLITRLLDWRTVSGGVKLPFTVRVGDGDPQWDEIDTLQTAAVNPLLTPNRFALPPNPPPDFAFPHDKTSVTVPFRLVRNKLLLPVRLNGRGPFDAELDSGGNYILQPALAARLHITSQGTVQGGGGGEGFVPEGLARMSTVDIAGLRLTDQPYKILGFSKTAPERTLLGLQILQRFVVSINFDRHTVTFTRPDRFVDEGGGVAVPFHFQDNQPEVNGVVDGIAGVFAVDTGDFGSLLLIAPFVHRYGLVERYHATNAYRGGAVGGATHGLMAHTGTLALLGPDGRAALSVHGLETRLSQQTGGFDADRYVSGNVGMGVLQQFNLVFDYARQRIIFQRRAKQDP